jgi:acetylglutamate kinase
VVLLKLVGMNPVVVHGGGPQIETALRRLGKKGELRQGMRVTDAETMDIVEMVLGGQVNKEVVELINQAGGKAVGPHRPGRRLHPRQENAARFERERPRIDIGQVGEIDAIDPAVISRWSRRLHPVVRPIAPARTASPTTSTPTSVAGKLAEILRAENLIVLTNTPGVLDKSGKLLTGLTPRKIDDLVAKGVISGGMLPKIGSVLGLRRAPGVKSCHIIDGRVPHALLMEVLTDEGVGTVIRSSNAHPRGAAFAAGVDLRPRQHAARRAAAHLSVDARPDERLPDAPLRARRGQGAN